MIPPLILLLPILFFGGIVSTISGGGLGILLTVAATFFTDVRTSVVLVSLLGFVIQIVKIAHFRRFARWDIIRWYIALGVPMSAIGALFLFILPERAIEIALGIGCIVFCATDLLPGKLRMMPSRRTLIITGAANGLMSGAVGQGMLLRAPALLAFGLTKEQFVGTSAIIALMMNLGKTSVYLTQFAWSRDVVILLLAAVPTVWIGVDIGRRILCYVHPLLFEKILLSIVLIGAVRLIFFSA